MGQALYRKYRSRTLTEVVGQKHITDTLARAVKAGRISHAYLFTGPHGVGKTSVARILAHEINQLPYSETPHLDIIEIDAASNRRIDDIRDLRDKVHIAPINAKYKVYIIDEVHMLTGESFNALLKTLEEPPSHVVFILATTEVHKLPATIISRTQRYAFKSGELDAVAAHLASIAKKEGITIEDDALALIAEHGRGSFRDSVSLLDQLAHITSGTVKAIDVAAMLGLTPTKQVRELVEALTKQDPATIIKLATAFERQGSSITALTDQLTKELLNAALDTPAFLPLIDQLLDVPRAYNPYLKLITTLSGYIAPKKAEPKTAATLVTQVPAVTIVQATPHAVKKPRVIAETAPESLPAPEPIPAPINEPSQPLSALEPADWNKVLSAIKANNAPLYAVVKQAQPLMQDGALVLTFKFALHGKKIDNAKQKAAIAAATGHVLGAVPAIRVATNKDAAPPIITDDPAIAKVAAIMGGGEKISADL